MNAVSSLLGGLARRAVRALVRLYYPSVEVTPADRVPPAGPVLLAANHPNSMLDPVIVGIAARRPVRFLAKAPLFDIPVFGSVMRALGMLPAYRESDDPSQVSRNVDTLAAGAQVLIDGHALGIFPEGKSHDAARVELIRSGAARIAIQAAQGGARGLKVFPVGLNYQDKERFRSAVWARVGEPIDVDRWIADHEGNARKSMRELTRELDRRLKELAVHLNEENWEPFLNDLEVLLPAPPERSADRIAPLRQRKRIADAMNYYLAANRPRAEAAAESISAHRSSVAGVGVSVDSPVLRLEGAALFLRMWWEPLWLVLCLPFALVGAILHIVPFLVVRAIAHRIQGRMRATTSIARLGLGLPFYGLTYAFVAWLMRAKWDFMPWVVWTWLGLMPVLGIFALEYARRAREAARLWWHQVRLWLRRPELAALRRERLALRLRLKDLAEEYARAFPPEAEPPPPSRARLYAMRTLKAGVATAIVIAAVAWGRAWLTTERLDALRIPGPDLSRYSADELERALKADEAALAQRLRDLAGLEARAQKLREEFLSGQRNYYRQADNDAVRQLLMDYLSYRKELLRLIWKYQEFRGIRDDRSRLRAFLVDVAAGAALYDASLKFVMEFAHRPETVKKFNEAEPLWDIPSGVYDTVRLNLMRRDHRKMLDRVLQEHRERREDFGRFGLATEEPYRDFHAAIQRAQESIERLSEGLWQKHVDVTYREAKGMGSDAWYKAQSAIATWIGDTKLRAPRSGRTLMDPQKLAALRAQLKPGDILLERRNWFLSNAFLPGYWPHAALYVGTASELSALGLDQDPRVKAHWAEFSARDAAGHEHVIVEALSEGIVCATMEHSIGGGDSVAVLRPRIPPERIREAICRGFSHMGKPYDFEFDFFSTDKIVCTELVFRAYDGDVEFPLVDVMGRKTLPAIEIVRKYANERGTERAQLEFIGFLDGDEKSGECRTCDEEAFLRTLQRPGMTLLQGITGPGQ